MFEGTVFIINHDKKIYRMDGRSDKKIPNYDESKVEVTSRKRLGGEDGENSFKTKLNKKGYRLTDAKEFEEFEKQQIKE